MKQIECFKILTDFRVGTVFDHLFVRDDSDSLFETFSVSGFDLIFHVYNRMNFRSLCQYVFELWE